jgi:hypothetical protein
MQMTIARLGLLFVLVTRGLGAQAKPTVALDPLTRFDLLKPLSADWVPAEACPPRTVGPRDMDWRGIEYNVIAGTSFGGVRDDKRIVVELTARGDWKEAKTHVVSIL